jgi:hypothetical protein
MVHVGCLASCTSQNRAVVFKSIPAAFVARECRMRTGRYASKRNSLFPVASHSPAGPCFACCLSRTNPAPPLFTTPPPSYTTFASFNFAPPITHNRQRATNNDDKMFVQLLAAAALCYLAWSIVTLQINYRRASTMGIPLIRLPVDPLNVPFQVFEPHIFRLLDTLPIRLPEFLYCLRRGWYFGDKADMHLKYGPIWAFVTPRDIHVLLADSEAIHQVYSRRGDFLRPRKMYGESCIRCHLSRKVLMTFQSFWKCTALASQLQTQRIGLAIARFSQHRSTRAQ